MHNESQKVKHRLIGLKTINNQIIPAMDIRFSTSQTFIDLPGCFEDPTKEFQFQQIIKNVKQEEDENEKSN